MADFERDSCESFSAQIFMLDGDPEGELAAHIDSCEKCRGEYRKLCEMRELVKHSAPQTPELRDAVLERIKSENITIASASYKKRRRIPLGTIAAAVAVLAIYLSVYGTKLPDMIFSKGYDSANEFIMQDAAESESAYESGAGDANAESNSVYMFSDGGAVFGGNEQKSDDAQADVTSNIDTDVADEDAAAPADGQILRVEVEDTPEQTEVRGSDAEVEVEVEVEAEGYTEDEAMKHDPAAHSESASETDATTATENITSSSKEPAGILIAVPHTQIEPEYSEETETEADTSAETEAEEAEEAEEEEETGAEMEKDKTIAAEPTENTEKDTSADVGTRNSGVGSSGGGKGSSGGSGGSSSAAGSEIMDTEAYAEQTWRSLEERYPGKLPYEAFKSVTTEVYLAYVAMIIDFETEYNADTLKVFADNFRT